MALTFPSFPCNNFISRKSPIKFFSLSKLFKFPLFSLKNSEFSPFPNSFLFCSNFHNNRYNYVHIFTAVTIKQAVQDQMRHVTIEPAIQVNVESAVECSPFDDETAKELENVRDENTLLRKKDQELDELVHR